MSPSDVVSSPADLSASFDGNAAVTEAAAPNSGVDLAAEPSSPDNEGADFDELNATGEESPEVEDQEPPTPDNVTEEAEEEVEEPQAAKADGEDEELPEGVRRGQDRSGRRGLFVTPERWKA